MSVEIGLRANYSAPSQTLRVPDLILRCFLQDTSNFSIIHCESNPLRYSSCPELALLAHEQLPSSPTPSLTEYVSHNATLNSSSWPELLLLETFVSSHQPSTFECLDTDMLSRHTAAAITSSQCSARNFQPYIGRYREAMGTDEPPGASGSVDGVEGSDEDRLA